MGCYTREGGILSGVCKACSKVLSRDEMCNANPCLEGSYEELCFRCLSTITLPSRQKMRSDIYHLIEEKSIVDELADIFLKESHEADLTYKIDLEGFPYDDSIQSSV